MLGMALWVWAATLCVLAATTLVTVLFFRALIAGSAEDELLVDAAEAERTRRQLRTVGICVRTSGWACATLFALTVVLWIGSRGAWR